MKIINIKNQHGFGVFASRVTIAVLLSILFFAVPANAAKRDVIADANAICGGANPAPADSLADACYLLDDTNGGQDLNTQGCNSVFDDDDNDNGIVDYLFRNCDRNEEALLRKAAGAVLSLRDFYRRGKTQQAGTAGRYLCSYASKFSDLSDATPPKLESEEPLDLNAENIADDIGFPCL